jgi:hypothetical protein
LQDIAYKLYSDFPFLLSIFYQRNKYEFSLILFDCGFFTFLVASAPQRSEKEFVQTIRIEIQMLVTRKLKVKPAPSFTLFFGEARGAESDANGFFRVALATRSSASSNIAPAAAGSGRAEFDCPHLVSPTTTTTTTKLLLQLHWLATDTIQTPR